MTPQRRLDQIEPEIADLHRKTDRLVETSGRVLDEVSKIAFIERNVQIIATGQATLANTVTTGQTDLTNQVAELRQDVIEPKDSQQATNQKLDFLIALVQERLK